jgi:beta-lactam-binding protein with PASTA domain
VTDRGTGGGGGSGGKITLPNEVGNQLQAAQDDLQAHGLYNLSNEDATGQGRFLIYDRNWKVVDQSPPAGTKVSEGQHITLSAKKYTDP